MFSDRERDILKIIGRKKLTLRVIAEKLFLDDYNKPFDTEISVRNSIVRIIRKCEMHDLKWTLIKTRKNGKLLISKG